jgi:hypothetical protein
MLITGTRVADRRFERPSRLLLIPALALFSILVWRCLRYFSLWKNADIPGSFLCLWLGVLIWGATKAYIFEEFKILEILLFAFGIIVLSLNILRAQIQLDKKK